MIMRFKNKTNQAQQINFINGSGVKVFPVSPKDKNSGFVDINITELYKEELERAKRFFTISPVPEKKDFSEKIKFTETKKLRR